MKKYYLSVCAIVKNEALYLDEWIAFHQLQGVEHFYFYDNESTDETYDILRRYEELGIVTLNSVVGTGRQLPSYNHYLQTYGKDSQWCAFLDCDEFLHTTKSNLPTLLGKYENHPAVAVNWILYGSSGHKTYEPGLLIERFPMRAMEANPHVKSIVQPHLTNSTGKNSHYFKLKGAAVDENKKTLPEVYSRIEPSVNIFGIAHFHVKSEEEYFKRKLLGEPDGVVRGNIQERFKVHDVNEWACTFLLLKGNEVQNQIEKNQLKYLEKVWDSLEPKPWLVKEEFIQFMKFIHDNNIKTILEIGTHKGGTASALLALGCSVVSVDIVKQPEIGLLESDQKFKFFFREDFGLDEDYMHFDLLFIDGDHSYNSSMQDYYEYRFLVREGGFIAFHDVVKSELHEKQQCEVWRTIEDILKEDPTERIDFITDSNWGGISILKA